MSIGPGMFPRSQPRNGVDRKVAGIAVALGLLLLVAFASVRPAAAAPRAQASSACSGPITLWFGLSGIRRTASGIRTANVSCAVGRGVVRTFLLRAGSHSGCLNAAERPSPTLGCAAAGYRCFLARPGRLPYCAAPSRRSVQWRLSPASASCALIFRPFVSEITVNARVTCVTAHAAMRVWTRTELQVGHFRAAGRQWTFTRRNMARFALTRLRSGNADVYIRSLPYS